MVDLGTLDLSNMMLPIAPLYVGFDLAAHVSDISILHLRLIELFLKAPG